MHLRNRQKNEAQQQAGVAPENRGSTRPLPKVVSKKRTWDEDSPLGKGMNSRYRKYKLLQQIYFRCTVGINNFCSHKLCHLRKSDFIVNQICQSPAVKLRHCNSICIFEIKMVYERA